MSAQIELLQELLKGDTDRPEYLRDLAMAHFTLAHQQLTLGEKPAATAQSRRAAEIAQGLARRFPENRGDSALLLRTLDLGATLLWLTGEITKAEESSRRAVEIGEKLVRDNPAGVYRSVLAGAMNNLALQLQSQGRHTDAVALLKRAVEHQKTALESEPKSEVARQYLRNQTENLAAELGQLNKSDEALQALSRSVTLGEALMTDYPARPQYRHDLAESYHNLGNLQGAAGRKKAAEQSYGRADRVDQRLAKEFPNIPRYQWVVAQSSLMLGDLLREASRASAARDAYRCSVDCYERLATMFPKTPEFRDGLADAARTLAWFLSTCADPQMRDPVEALKLARRAVELDPQDAKLWRTLGLAHYRAGAWCAAIEAVRKSMAVPVQAGGQPAQGSLWTMNTPTSMPQPSGRFILAMAQWRMGRKDEARKSYAEAVGLVQQNRALDADASGLRAEAAAVLGVTDDPKAAAQKKEENPTRRSKP